MKYNLGVFELVPFGSEEFIEVKIEEALSRKVAHIKTREFVFLFLELPVSLLMADCHVLELLFEHVGGLLVLSVCGLAVSSLHHRHWLLTRLLLHHGLELSAF